MTLEKSNIKFSGICEKCSGRMMKRKMAIKDNGSIKWQRIKQCVNCKHWYPID